MPSSRKQITEIKGEGMIAGYSRISSVANAFKFPVLRKIYIGIVNLLQGIRLVTVAVSVVRIGNKLKANTIRILKKLCD